MGIAWRLIIASPRAVFAGTAAVGIEPLLQEIGDG
jgi:hypothetical protein